MNEKYRIIIVNGKRKFEHRYLMEKLLKRELLRNEHVHHIDGNRLNNELSNLALMEASEHIRIHHIGMPILHKRLSPVLLNLPEAVKEGDIVSILPMYKKYKTFLCSNCKKLFWARKDYTARKSDCVCSTKCCHIMKGHNVRN